MKQKWLSTCLVVALVLVLATVFLLAPGQPLMSTTCACTPPPGGHIGYSTAERTDNAEIVLEGTVAEIEGDWLQTAQVEVKHYFKGHGPERVTISNLGPGSLCLSSVVVGQQWIFYAKGNPPAELTASYMGAGDALDPITSETVSQVIATVGHDPLPPYRSRIYLPIF